MGLMYFYGKQVKRSEKLALYYWKKAEKLGNKRAVLEIAILFNHSEAKTSNVKTALKYKKLAFKMKLVTKTEFDKIMKESPF